MSDIGQAFGAFMKFIAVLLAIFVPLGLWKLIDILVWLWTHIHFSGGT